MSKTTPPTTPKQPGASQDQAMQGEGNYEAARRHRESVEEFVEAGKVKPAAKAAKPEDAQTAEALKKAEAEGKSHAKG